MRIDVRGSDELRDLFIAIQGMDRDVRRYFRALTKSKMTTPYLQTIQNNARTPLERKVIAQTATLATSDQNVRLQAAGKGRALSGGLAPKFDYPAVEFGASRGKRTTYRGRRGGTTFSVTRRTTQQLKPRNARGYVFYPTVTEIVPRLASLWAQTIVRGIGNLFDGKPF